MVTKRYTQCYRPAELQVASAGLLGNRATFKLDRTNPIEEIFLVLDCTVSSTAITVSARSSPVIVDNILGLVRRFQLLVQEGTDSNQRPAIDCSGIGLLEFATKVSGSVDRSTQRCIALSQLASVPANTTIRLTLRIPMVHPMIGEPLRQYCLLPVHTHPVDPVVNIDFAAGTDFQATNHISALVGHLFIVRRIMSSAQTAQIQSKGGFLRQDIIETAYSMPLSTSGDVPGGGLHLPLGGQYSTLVFRQYRGGSTVTRDVIDATTTFGSESVWQLRQGTTPLYEWRWKDLDVFAENTFLEGTGSPIVADVFVAATSAGSPTTELVLDICPDICGGLVSTATYKTSASTILNFLGDGVEQAMELGGLLDADGPIRAGQNLDLYGQFGSVATNPSVLYVVAHRFYGVSPAWLASNL